MGSGQPSDRVMVKAMVTLGGWKCPIMGEMGDEGKAYVDLHKLYTDEMYTYSGLYFMYWVISSIFF